MTRHKRVIHVNVEAVVGEDDYLHFFEDMLKWAKDHLVHYKGICPPVQTSTTIKDARCQKILGVMTEICENAPEEVEV